MLSAAQAAQKIGKFNVCIHFGLSAAQAAQKLGIRVQRK